MNKQTILLIAFGAMVIWQLWLPAQSALRFENALKVGETFKFETALVDPNDPFRGKYVTLNFPSRNIDVSSMLTAEELKELTYEQSVYCELGTDERGFAKIIDISLDPPAEEVSYFQARLNSYARFNDEISDVDLYYPFERFYLEESKAPEAERRYKEAIRDTLQEAYAVVKIHNGLAVLEDVVVNGVSITQPE